MEGREWRKSKPSLAQAASHIFETGLYSDLTFRIGPQLHEFKSHRMMIMLRSETFAVMFQDCCDDTENSEDGNRNVIDFPHYDPQSFGCFLKNLYTDELEDPGSVEVTLRVLNLAHVYKVHGLVSKSCALLISQINLRNCVEIYQATRIYSDKEIQLSYSAFDFITRNIKHLVRNPSFVGFDKDGLLQLFQCDKLEVDETDLFKAVLKWSEFSDVERSVQIAGTSSNYSKTSQSRKIQLKALIPLIRFPLMGADKFTKEVVPLKVLSDKTVRDMFLYFNGGNVDGLKFSTIPRFSSSIQATPLPRHFKLLKCFDKEISYRYDELIDKFGAHTAQSPVNDLGFFVSTPIVIQGLSFYGFTVRRRDVGDSDFSNSTSMSAKVIGHESIGVTIYKCDPRQVRYNPHDTSNMKETIVAQKWSKVMVSEGKEFNLLFDKPAKILPSFPYFINISLNFGYHQPSAKKRRIPGDEYLFSVGNFIRSSKQMSAYPLTMLLKIGVGKENKTEGSEGPCQQSRMIHSIIYTIE